MIDCGLFWMYRIEYLNWIIKQRDINTNVSLPLDTKNTCLNRVD